MERNTLDRVIYKEENFVENYMQSQFEKHRTGVHWNVDSPKTWRLESTREIDTESFFVGEQHLENVFFNNSS